MTTTSRPQYLSHTGAPAPAPTSGTGTYDYRYEFSETRKVLEEFFKAENEFPAASSGVSPGSQARASYTDSSSIHPDRKHQQPRGNTCHVSDTNPVPPQDMDLDYSLTRLEVHNVRALLLNYYQNSLYKTVLQGLS